MRHLVRGGDGELHSRHEVLDQWELAIDLGWMLPSRVRVSLDPALVDEVVALQAGSA